MSATRAAFLLLAGLLFAAPATALRAADLPPAFVSALRQSGIPLDRVAVVVQPLDAPQPLLSHHADAALNPASVMKLVTSFAALDQLGPGYRWATDLWTAGPVADGVLSGDLIVKGYGDPTLTLERMWLLQRELRARGVQHVRGNLVLDPSYFDVPPVDPGAFDGEPYAPYNAVPAALVANFNAVTLRLKPAEREVLIVPDIALPGVTLTSRLVLTEAQACDGWKDALVPAFPAGERVEMVVAGRYARSCGEQAWSLNLFEPAATFDFIFRGLWAESGGTLTGTTVSGQAPQAAPFLRFTSEPLTDALTRLNKFSNNLMTRNLLLTLGAEKFGAPATPEKGALAVREALLRRGVPIEKLVIDNGAGLSRIERVSARTLNALLHAAYNSPLFAEFEAALPIAALDGTLKRRFNGSPLSGNAHLKTGTLRDVSALAGYVFTARGRRMSFVMLVNHANARNSEAAQRTLLEWVWADAAGEGPAP
jgi:D-alanyl-D-alanine carboxypeptidase/D-alanyl-D-alanine-endopeptidase (penicillin-binding protein 4)